MADGDIIHPKLSGIYYKAYQQLCEGKLPLDECARSLINALLKDIKNKGKGFIQLAQKIGQYLNQAIAQVPVNWPTVRSEINHMIDQSRNLFHYDREIVRRAAQSIVCQLKNGEIHEVSDLQQVMVTQSMEEVYLSRFKERIPLNSDHYGGVSDTILDNQINNIEPSVKLTIEGWSETANQTSDVAKLRMSRRQNIKPIDLEEDLLS